MYYSPSIKHHEIEKPGATKVDIKIIVPDQKMTEDFQKALHSSMFKNGCWSQFTTEDTLVISISELAAKFGMNLKYVCGLYNMPIISSVNEARFQLFLKKNSPKINNQPLSKIKESDLSMFPHCLPVLINKLLRV